MTSLGILPEEKEKDIKYSKSCESFNSLSSSKYSATSVYGGGSNKKLIQSTYSFPMRQSSMYAFGTKEVRQRVLSARRQRIKSIQNELTSAQQTIDELIKENRTLTTLRKRSEAALEKYENKNSGYKGLMLSHAEEIRIWRIKYKKLQTFNKELMEKIKRKDDELLKLTDLNKHLNQLNNDKNLEERQQLAEKVRQLEEKLMEKDKDIRLLSRKLQLEEKNFKVQIQQEHFRYKDLQTKFEELKLKTNEKYPNHCNHMNGKNSKTSLLPTRTKSCKDIIRDRTIQQRKEADDVIIHNCNGNISDHSHNSSVRTNVTNNDEKLSSSFRKPGSVLSFKSNISTKTKESSYPSGIGKIFADTEFSDEETVINPNGKFSKQSEEYTDSFESENKDESMYNMNSADKAVKNNHVNGKDPPPEECKNSNDEDSESDEKLTEDFRHIRKKISKDYEQKKVFLDSFCNQSSESSVSPNLTAREQQKHRFAIDPTKKSKLIAALKDIDSEKILKSK